MCRVCAEATVYLAHRLQPSARQYSIDAVVFSVIRTAVIHVIRTAAVPADALCQMEQNGKMDLPSKKKSEQLLAAR